MNKKINTILKMLMLILLVLSTITVVSASSLGITNLYVRSMGDGWINVFVDTNGTGTLGLSIDKVQVWTKTVNSTIGSGNQFEIGSGKHEICAYDTVNKGDMMICQTLIMQTPSTDVEPPEITDVSIDTSTPNVGDKITVKIVVIDNVDIIRVTTNEIESKLLLGNTWKCQITALEGKHGIFVIAYDTAGNKDADYSQSYTSKVVSTPTPTPTPSPSPTPTQSSLNLSSNSTPTPTPDTTKKDTSSSKNVDVYGRLNIDSDPGEADIFLNNVRYGKTPYSADVEIGSYTVKLTKEDYKNFTKMVNVRENGDANVIAKLVMLNGTTNTENNQTNQSAIMNNGNSKQNNGDSLTSLYNNMTILAVVVVIAAAAIICVIIYSRKPTQINYANPSSITNEKSMIVLKRADDRR